MRIPVERADRCPLCTAARFEPFAGGCDFESSTCANDWTFVRCTACRHVWLNPRPAREALAVIYPPDYYAYDYEHRVGPVARRGKAWLDGLKLRAIRRRLPGPPRSYLDVGCGTGRYLRAMERHGVPRSRIYGLELEAGIARRLAAEGYRVRAGPVESSPPPADHGLDLVTMFHVIEHVADPGAVIRAVEGWLNPGGVLAIETPNLDSLDARLFRPRFWGGYHFPRHWHLFTPATLGRLLTDAGLEPIETRYQSGHAFWMYSLHHALRYRARPWPRLARCFDPFASLPPLALFTAFDRLRALLGFRTSSMLMLARRHEKSRTAAPSGVLETGDGGCGTQ